jgi:glutamate/tyrosine decarboxylase-like PLP-dependent enzyme
MNIDRRLEPIAQEKLDIDDGTLIELWMRFAKVIEVEQRLIRSFARQVGYDVADADDTFTGGGAEANRTALLTGLVHKFPEYARNGMRGLDRQPTLYVSTQTNHTYVKAACPCGLGSEAVRRVPVDGALQMNVEALVEQVSRDRAAGFAPYLVVATAGDTNARAIDPIARIAEVAAREGLWLHTDAARGGAAIIVPELRHLLGGIEQSDSIAFDAQKWLSVPMGAALYLTRHRSISEQAFHIRTDYRKLDRGGPVNASQGLLEIEGRIRSMLETLQETGLRHRYRTHMAVKTGRRVMIVDVLEIDWIGAAGDYVTLHVGEKDYLARRKIGSLERELDPGRSGSPLSGF